VTEETLDRFRGCLVGGAVGDALGAPVEFLSRAEIRARFGEPGIASYEAAYGRRGAITDDTQMTLFTAEGLLRAWVWGASKGITTYSGVTAGAYLRWLRTQGMQGRIRGDELSADGWLYQQDALHSRRAPGNTCLSALQRMTTLGERARNDSKGCGGVMRVAPVGLFARSLGDALSQAETFELGVELVALTHGHPTGSLAAGALALLVRELVGGAKLEDALASTRRCLLAHPDHGETLRAIEQAESLAASSMSQDNAIDRLGAGWIAEEALALSIYCTLVAGSFREGVMLAVNHGGDSDSTGAIAGNLLGCMHGMGGIPQEWLEELELRDVIEELATDLHAFPEWPIGADSGDAPKPAAIIEKYPPV